MKHQFSPILEGMEMSKTEQEWLDHPVEQKNVKEEL